MSEEPLVTIKELAERLKGNGVAVSRVYIYAMIAAGYQMTHGKLTTVSSARQWLKDHPEFTTTDYVRAAHNGRRGGKVRDQAQPILTSAPAA